MEKTDSIRERLLSQLPRTDNVAAYKEEVAVLLAKHKRALYWDDMTTKLVGFIAVVFYSLGLWARARNPGSQIPHDMFAFAGMIFLVALIQSARYRVSQSQFALLKEIKQLQVQMLELQASLERKSDE